MYTKPCIKMVTGCTISLHFIFRFSFFVNFGDGVTKISCHFQAKTVQLIFSFFVIYEKRKWDETLIIQNFTPF